MRVNKILFVLILLMFFMVGCASPGVVNKKDYYNRLGKIELGMTKSEFKRIFPESIPKGAKQYPKGPVEVLAVGYIDFFEYPQWFYFYNGKLLQYGKPRDWPSDPDLIIEQRIR